MSEDIKIVVSNKKAFHDYHILERVEAGIALTGTEVKSLRDGNCNLKDSYARIRKGQAWLINLNIGSYKNAGYSHHDPERPRKLLLHRHEISRIFRKVTEKGVTLIPLRIYFKRGIAKVELGIAAGKREYDKREAITRRDQALEMKRLEKKFRIK